MKRATSTQAQRDAAVAFARAAMLPRREPLCATNPAFHSLHFSDYTHRHVCVECGKVASDEEEAADASAVDVSISVPDGEVY